MTNAELIEALRRLDPNAQAEVGIQVYTRRYCVAYCSGPKLFVSGQRIIASLPKNMHTVERKV